MDKLYFLRDKVSFANKRHLFLIFFFYMTTIPPFHNPTKSAPRPFLSQVDDQLNKRIDDDTAKLVDCFTDIVRIGEVKEYNKL